MSSYTDKISYFDQLSQKNKAVAHKQPIAVGSTDLRKSFISVEEEEGLAAAMETGIYFPCVVIVKLSGTIIDKDYSFRKKWSNNFYFLDKQQADDEETKKKLAYDATEKVMNQFISKMWNDYEEDGNCGPFNYLELNGINFSQTGRISDGLYGWRLSFPDEQNATDITNYDATKWTD